MQPPNLTAVVPQQAEQYLVRLAAAVTAVESQLASISRAGYITRAQVTGSVDATAIQAALQSNGSKPLNVTNLLGRLAQPQLAGAPQVSALPGPNDPLSQEGALIRFNGLLYYFDQSTDPGAWKTVNSVGSLITGTHAQRIAAPYTPTTNYPTGSLFYETDRKLTYVVIGNAWRYYEGLFTTSYASIAGLGLGANDAGLLLFVNDYDHTLKWSGTVWGWAPGDRQGGWIEGFKIDPDNLSGGWALCDGSNTTWLKITAGVLSIPAVTTDNLVGSPAYLKLGAAATGINAPVAATIAAGVTGSSATGDSATTITILTAAGATQVVDSFTAAAGHTHTIPATTATNGEPGNIVLRPWFRR